MDVTDLKVVAKFFLTAELARLNRMAVVYMFLGEIPLSEGLGQRAGNR